MHEKLCLHGVSTSFGDHVHYLGGGAIQIGDTLGHMHASLVLNAWFQGLTKGGAIQIGDHVQVLKVGANPIGATFCMSDTWHCCLLHAEQNTGERRRRKWTR